MSKFFKVHQMALPLILCTKNLDHVLPVKVGSTEWVKGLRSKIICEEVPGRLSQVFVDETVNEVFDILERKTV